MKPKKTRRARPRKSDLRKIEALTHDLADARGQLFASNNLNDILRHQTAIAQGRVQEVYSRLRAIARHSFVLPRDEKYPIDRDWTRAAIPRGLSMSLMGGEPPSALAEGILTERLFFLMNWAEKNQDQFVKYLHFCVREAETGLRRETGFALSETAWKMLCDGGREQFVRHIAEDIAEGVWVVLNKENTT